MEFIEAATSNQVKHLVFRALSDVFGNLTRTTCWRVATHVGSGRIGWAIVNRRRAERTSVASKQVRDAIIESL